MAKRKGDITDVTDPDGNFLEEGETALETTVEDDFPIASEETEAVRQQIKTLTQSISNCYYDLSILVWKVNKDKLYKTWGYGKFEDWACEELGFQRRKAYYLVEFQEYCNKDLRNILPDTSEYNSAIDQLKEVGWTKALELAKSKVLTRDNCHNLLEEAKEDKIEEFVGKLKIIKNAESGEKDDGVTENTMKKVKRTFSLTTAQEELLQTAIEKAKAAIKRDEVSDEFALEYIVGDFIASFAGSMSASLSHVERIHNVSLVAFSDNNREVVYGEETLRAISQSVNAGT